MPIYEFVSVNPGVKGESCVVCSKVFELRRPMDRGGLEKCPVCRNPVKKVVSQVNTKVVSRERSDREIREAGMKVLRKNCDGKWEDGAGGLRPS